eukprot:COSAG05_NODE_1451_length_4851_cov_2.309343_1_plen_1464_part_00
MLAQRRLAAAAAKFASARRPTSVPAVNSVTRDRSSSVRPHQPAPHRFHSNRPASSGSRRPATARRSYGRPRHVGGRSTRPGRAGGPRRRQKVSLAASLTELEWVADPLPTGDSRSALVGGHAARTPAGHVARTLGQLRAGERTPYLQKAAELGLTNAGVAMEYLRLVFTEPDAREWQAGEAELWAASAAELLADAGLELRPEALLWVLSHCARAGAEAGRACVVLSLAEHAGMMQQQPSPQEVAESSSSSSFSSLSSSGAVVPLYSALINVAAKQRRGSNFPLAQQLLNRLRAITRPSSSSAAGASTSSSGVSESHRDGGMMSMAAAATTGPNEVTHNSVIDAFGRQRRGGGFAACQPRAAATLAGPAAQATVLDSCVSLLEDMIERDGLSPSARTLTGLTYAIGRTELQQGLAPPRSADGARAAAFSSSSLAAASDGLDTVQPAFAVLDILRQHRLQPDVVFYTSLMHACVATSGGADLESAYSILYMLEAEVLTPSIPTYNELLAACALAQGGGQPEQAEAVLARMEQTVGAKPTARSYVPLSACHAWTRLERTHIVVASVILHSILLHRDSTARPTLIAGARVCMVCRPRYNWVLEAYARAPLQPPNSSALLAVRQPLSPLERLEQLGVIEASMSRLVSRMGGTGVQPTGETFVLLALAAVRQQAALRDYISLSSSASSVAVDAGPPSSHPAAGSPQPGLFDRVRAWLSPGSGALLDRRVCERGDRGWADGQHDESSVDTVLRVLDTLEASAATAAAVATATAAHEPAPSRQQGNTQRQQRRQHGLFLASESGGSGGSTGGRGETATNSWGVALRRVLSSMATLGYAEQSLMLLEDLAAAPGKSRLLRRRPPLRVRPSDVEYVLQACAVAAASQCALHPCVQVWAEEAPPRAGSSATSDRAIANHAQLAVQVAESSVIHRQYGMSAAWLSPGALEWLVVACIHDTANAISTLPPAAGAGPATGRREHVQYISLSRATELLERLHSRLPAHRQAACNAAAAVEARHGSVEGDAPTLRSDGTALSEDEYSARLRWGLHTLRLLHSLVIGADTSSSSSEARDDRPNSTQSNASSPSTLAALIRSCTHQSLHAVTGEAAVAMASAGYAAAVTANPSLIGGGQDPVADDVDVFTAIIEGWAHAAATPSAGEPNAVHANAAETAAAGASGAAGQVAFRVLDTMREMSVEPQLATFNALLGVFAVSHELSLALTALDMMIYRRITPDHQTFIHLIKSCGADAAAAQQIYDDYFVASGLPPSVAVFEALLEACAAAGALEGAARVLSALEQSPALDDGVTLTASDRCLDAVLVAAAANTTRALPLPSHDGVNLRSMDSEGDCSSTSVAASAAAGDGVAVAVVVLERMSREGRQPSGEAVLKLLRALEGTPIIHGPVAAADAAATKDARERRRILELVGHWVPQGPRGAASNAAGAPRTTLRWSGGTTRARRGQQREVEVARERLWDPL